ncbi:TetR/AcrR family transcriptional regulator [Methanobacterium petrolearium]|uniref:TetR/AcrR family transcriptional regulator n=1 Tax=Methanobacterium petrolearium TaxID=710190 RepID=UPI003081F9DA|nr:TetR family transcriptional regulator [Methanobacterium petrolearium]
MEGKRKKQRRENIIDAAKKLFFETDYDNVSMDEIAKEIGLGKGTLYIYFNSKESLFYAVALRGMQILNSVHLKYLNQKKSGLNKLHALIDGYFQFTQEYPEYFHMLCYAASNPSSITDNEYAKDFTDLALGNIQISTKILEECMVEGTVRRDLHPTEMAIFLSIMGNSITNMDPVWKVTLKAAGTGKDKIWEHYLRFITPAIETNHGLDLSVTEMGDEEK